MIDKSFPYEFGGPYGVSVIIILSHIVLYYFYGCLGVEDWMPTTFTITTYAAFVVIEALFAYILPGVWTKGLPLEDPVKKEKYCLDYLCNGLSSWYVTLVMLFGLHYSGYFRLYWITENIGRYVTTAVVYANISSLIIYTWGLMSIEKNRSILIEKMKSIHQLLIKIERDAKKEGTPVEYPRDLLTRSNEAYDKLEKSSSASGMSGNDVYDVFMGSILNPRIGILDLKMFAEIRVSWMLLFLITTSNALKQYQVHGYISNSMIIIWLAQVLYTNACMKGEECIPTTWDIFHEKFGWMLIFWNLAGVPFLYAIQSYYIYVNDIRLDTHIFYLMLAVLGITYWIWDTANSQKNRFRMQRRGTFVKRVWAFPQFSMGTIDNPVTLVTDSGSELLVDGWWRIARKIHYTADLAMALIWGMCCGMDSFIPYFYFFFFLGHLLHRAKRDNERCLEKYGEDWKKYCKIVPYTFIPYVY